MISLIKNGFGLFLAGITLFLSCKSSETPPTDRVSVGLHQSARLSSEVVVRVDSIQDSRCPTGAYCIWAGMVRVKLLLSTANDSSVVQLSLGSYPSPNPPKRPDSTNATLDNSIYKVILRGVTAYPGYPSTNEPQMAIVQVTKI